MTKPAPQPPEALAACFDAEALPHLNDLYRMALRMTGERSQAEDAVQEACLQAWRSFSRYEAGTSCRAWLYRILFHCVQHQRRKLRRFPVPGESDQLLEDGIAYTPEVSEKLTDTEILGALDRLPETFRSVVLLADVEEFAYKEVAEILRIPIGTVMSRLSRGRKLLRGLLSQAARSYGVGPKAASRTDA